MLSYIDNLLKCRSNKHFERNKKQKAKSFPKLRTKVLVRSKRLTIGAYLSDQLPAYTTLFKTAIYYNIKNVELF